MSELKEYNHITVTLLWQKIQNILSTLSDGHTCAYASYPEWHYLKYITEMKNSGYHLTKVNELSINDLFNKISDKLSYDTESWGMEVMNSYLQSLEGLKFLGISLADGIELYYENDNGDIINKTCYEKDFLTYDEYMKYNHKEDTANAKSNFVTYSIDEDKSIAVLTLTSCRYNDQYCQCLKKMFAEIKEKNIKNVAVDLRSNGGGNSFVANEFIKYLNIPTYKITTDRWRLGFINLNNNHNIVKNHIYSDYIFTGSVYILTSTSTFSSAMEFAEYIKDNQLGIIIGEAPGNDAYGYGEIATFQCPNSKLYFQVSTKKFFRANLSIKEKMVLPDIPCKSEDAITVLFSKLQK